MSIAFDFQRWEKVRQTHRAWWKGELGRPLYHVALTDAPSDRKPSQYPAYRVVAFYGLDTPVEEVIDAWDYQLSRTRWLTDGFPSVMLNFGPGVIAAFRQHSVKPGLIEVEYGDIYGRVMDDRHISDYDVQTTIELDRARTDLEDAHRFVDRIERSLKEGDWL